MTKKALTDPPLREAETPPKSGSETDPLEPFNSRLPRSLQRRLKVHVALHDTKIQDVLGTALDEYLTRHGG